MNRALVTKLTSELNKHIKRDNSFYSVGINDGASDADEVTVNESADKPKVVKNPKQYPLKVYTTDDNKKTYKNHTFATEPVLISQDNEVLTKFNKQANEAEKHADELEQYVAEMIAYEWAAQDADYIVRTTGANTGTLAGAMTGTRKAITRSDIVNMHKVMTDAGIPINGRVMFVPTLLYYELLQQAGFTEYQLTGLVDPLFRNGTFAPMLGVQKIFLREKFCWYDNAGTPARQEMVSEGTEHDEMVENSYVAATNLAIQLVHPRYVRYNYGNGRFHYDSGKPEYNGGAVLNSTVRAGATKKRIDNKGVVALVQAP